MSFDVGYVDLANVDLIPLYDQWTDGHFIAFSADHIPGYRFQGEASILVYDTYRVVFRDTKNDWFDFGFNCLQRDYEYLRDLYMRGTNHVQEKVSNDL